MATKAMTPPRIVQEFPKAGREATYPWAEWTDGKIRELIRGVHFKGTIRSMRQTCSKHAQTNGMKVETRSTTRDGKELLYVRFTRK